MHLGKKQVQSLPLGVTGSPDTHFYGTEGARQASSLAPPQSNLTLTQEICCVFMKNIIYGSSVSGCVSHRADKGSCL